MNQQPMDVITEGNRTDKNSRVGKASNLWRQPSLQPTIPRTEVFIIVSS